MSFEKHAFNEQSSSSQFSDHDHLNNDQSAPDRQAILARLNKDLETEVTPSELKALLDAELAKPADEMDVQLVDDILAVLDDEAEPSADQVQAKWDAVVQKINERDAAGRSDPSAQRRGPSQHSHVRRTHSALRRVVAIIVAVIVASVAFVGTAKAFRWTFILKFFQPFAETFGIHDEDLYTTDDSPVRLIDNSMVTKIDDSQTAYASPEEMPTSIDGYQVVPEWVPERFMFENGTVYRDENFYVVDVYYDADDGWLDLTTTIFFSEAESFDVDFEKAIAEHETVYWNGLEVTIYQNTDDDIIPASWIDRNASYHLIGQFDREELEQIIESMRQNNG